MVAKIRRIIASFSIQNVMNGFIARVYPSRNRVPQGALERLERHAGKLACAVLRGLGGSNASRLLGEEVAAMWLPYPTFSSDRRGCEESQSGARNMAQRHRTRIETKQNAHYPHASGVPRHGGF